MNMRYNIVGMCIDFPSYENVDLQKLLSYDVMIRKGTYLEYYGEKYREPKKNSTDFGFKKVGSLHSSFLSLLWLAISPC
jgi:hypothetical protein